MLLPGSAGGVGGVACGEGVVVLSVVRLVVVIAAVVVVVDVVVDVNVDTMFDSEVIAALVKVAVVGLVEARFLVD